MQKNTKQTRPARKLALNRETLKRLTDSLTDGQLREVAGGRSAGCDGPTECCGYSDTQAPC